YFRRTYRELKRLDATTRSPIYAHFTESLGGVASIRALSLLDQFQRDSKGKIDDQTRVYWPMMTCNRWLSFRLEFCGSSLARSLSLSLSLFRSLSLSLALSLSLTRALSLSPSLSPSLPLSLDDNASMNSIERLDHYGNLPSEAPEEAGVDATLGSDWPQGGEVIFSDAFGRYREGTPLVLNSLSLYIKPGEKVGVVGRTGAGKSSLIVALFRLCELDAGSIKIDGNNIGALGLRTLRSRLAIVPQDPVLYSGSFRFNLDPYNEYSDEQIWAAIDTVNMRQKVGSLDEKVSEGGSNMSVGERQLLCMSRALLKKARIVILDEATAAVDMATDALIQTALREQVPLSSARRPFHLEFKVKFRLGSRAVDRILVQIV
ncbi:P-loop containing nucleoside triphosphate hydrolase protein, partial [Baffinella frigidus]